MVERRMVYVHIYSVHCSMSPSCFMFFFFFSSSSVWSVDSGVSWSTCIQLRQWQTNPIRSKECDAILHPSVCWSTVVDILLVCTPYNLWHSVDPAGPDEEPNLSLNPWDRGIRICQKLQSLCISRVL